MLDLATVAVVAVGLGLGGLVKGIAGMGMPIVAIPVIASVLGVEHTLALLIVPVLVSNLWQVWAYRAHAQGMQFLPGLVIGGAVGVLAGTYFLTTAPVELLSIVLGVLLLVYCLTRVLRPALVLDPTLASRLSPVVGIAAGALQGATGISSPIGGTYIHLMRLGREGFIFAISTMLLLFTAVQAVALIYAGTLDGQRLIESAIGVVPLIVMMWVGELVAKRFSAKLFDGVLTVFIAVMGVKFLWDGFGGG